MSGNIIVIEPECRFKKIDKSLIENSNIDCLTLGIYTKIVSLGKKWNLNVKGLSTFLGLSDTKVRKSISLLEKEGYIVRVPIKDEKGYFQGYNYKFFPTPIDEKERSNAGKKGGVIENRGSAKTGYPENGIPITNKTKNTFKTKLNKKENKKEKMKITSYPELKSAIKEDYLYKVASIYKLNKNTIYALLDAFVNVNKDKKSNEFKFCQHFENWLKTDKGQQAINNTRMTSNITNNYQQD